MLVTIENEYLKVTVDTLGAQLMSILGRDGCEYLWQGDPAYWGERAPVLFPFIGRLQDRQYRMNGKTYSADIHGFACRQEFSVVSHGEDTLTLALSGTATTWVNYPYEFLLKLTYQLKGNTLSVQNRVKNQTGFPMHFALGGHPGFRVPLREDESFEDYYLEFSQPCVPDRIGFTADTVLVSGQTTHFPLENGRLLPLRHDLFDDDAIILQNMARQVALKSHKSEKEVVVSCPDMPYLGFWHWPRKDAPYLCIEPWSSLPGRSGVLEDISCRSDFVHLAPSAVWENTWSITVQ